MQNMSWILFWMWEGLKNNLNEASSFLVSIFSSLQSSVFRFPSRLSSIYLYSHIFFIHFFLYFYFLTLFFLLSNLLIFLAIFLTLIFFQFSLLISFNHHASCCFCILLPLAIFVPNSSMSSLICKFRFCFDWLQYWKTIHF